ncbi:hypothetical protein [Streptomyces sp. XH2]|uniref:hypothetical protein n=1 Tax=Streptomyces sp. XH2 TaxID=3412483 RepID=UPI003C7D291A
MSRAKPAAQQRTANLSDFYGTRQRKAGSNRELCQVAYDQARAMAAECARGGDGEAAWYSLATAITAWVQNYGK